VIIEGERLKNVSGHIGVLPQNPQALFVKSTVELDLYEMLSHKKISKEEQKKKVDDVVEMCGLSDVLNQHPYDLSGGEQQRAAIAKVLLLNPKILLLDEPTKGLDAQFKVKLADILKGLNSRGVTVVMVSHDIEFCAEYADRCAMFFDGSIVSCDTPREFFSGKSFYTTATNRMARDKLPNAILPQDVIIACGGKLPERKKESNQKPQDNPSKGNNAVNTVVAYNKHYERVGISKSTLLALVMILFAVPLTIYLGINFLDDRKYYAISMIILIETLIPFAFLFERRKPQARELIVISVLCALAVAGRAVFYMLPQFKPVAAIVIIAGICFGSETGFLVGAITSFVSNMFVGQGPWTPWQMFAFGLIGFLAGVLFQKRLFRKNKASICIMGSIVTFVIYGIIMNSASVLMWQEKPNFEMLVSAYLVGVPFDLMHSAATAFFLYFISLPMIEKLERVKIKYGMI